MARLALSVLCSLILIGQSALPALAASSQPELKFKIYSPSGGSSSPAPTPAPASEDKGDGGFWTDAPPAADKSADAQQTAPAAESKAAAPAQEPAADSSAAATAPASTEDAPAAAATSTDSTTASTETQSAGNDKRQLGLKTESGTVDTQEPAAADTTAAAAPEATTTEPTAEPTASATPTGNKVLQGYIRVVPSGTKIPIIMDTAVDSDTSQEGDEFSARTSEDLNIDGSTVVPAGSVIKGRIAALNAPRALMRGGSVALKFDTVTTPDNRQIPLVANIVARGGVVHARRGMKDIAIDTGTVALPAVLGVGIGALAGNSATSVGTGGGALIGAGVGIAIGAIILCAKKGKKVDVRPGDELKIELAEDLRMPM